MRFTLCLVIWIYPSFHSCKSQVPVANGSSSYPFSLDVPRNTRFLFSNKTSTPAKAISKSIVSKYAVIYLCEILTLEPCSDFLILFY